MHPSRSSFTVVHAFFSQSEPGRIYFTPLPVPHPHWLAILHRLQQPIVN